MKKRFLVIILSVFMALSSSMLVGCNLFKKKDNQGSTHTHSYGEWIVTENATCYSDGKEVRTCSCGATEQRAIKGGHTIEVVDCKDPTCLADGWTAGKKCVVCQEVVEPTVKLFKIAHEYVVESTIAPTCDEVGYTIYKCKTCDAKYNSDIVQPTGHNFVDKETDGVEITQISGDKENHSIVHHQTCSKCGDERDFDLTAKHVLSTKVLSHANCTYSGEIEYTCSCGYTYTEMTSPNANAHNWESLDESTDKCSICQNTRTVKTLTKEDKITKDDINENVVLKVDNNVELKLDQTLINNLEGNVSLSADKVEKSSLNLNDNDKALIGDDDIYDFSLTNDTGAVDFNGGKIAVTIPYVLGQDDDPNCIYIWYIKDNGEVDKYEATYSNGFVTFEAEHFSYYAVIKLTKEQYCARYGHDILDLSRDATCSQDGYQGEVCLRCGHRPATNKTLPKLTHEYENEVIANGCLEEGYTLYTCKHCDSSYKDAVTAPIGHSFKEVEKVAATCKNGGYTLYRCEHCQEESFADTTDRVAHTYVNGTCNVCGNVQAQTDYKYINLFTSLFKDGISFNVENFSMVANVIIEDKDIYLDGKYVNINTTEESIVSNVDKMRFSFEYGENGINGEFDVALTAKYQNETAKIVAMGTILDNVAKISFSMNLTDASGNVLQDENGYVEMVLGENFENILPSPEMAWYLEMIPQVVEKIEESKILDVVGGLVSDGTKSGVQFVNEFLAKTICDTKVVNGEKTYTLNWEKLSTLIDNLNQKTIAEVIDVYYGAGSFDKALASIQDLGNLTLADLLEVIEERGLTKEELITLVNDVYALVMPQQGQADGEQPTFDFADYIENEQFTSMSVDSLLQQQMEMSVEEVVAMIDGMASEGKLFDLIGIDYELYAEKVDTVITELSKYELSTSVKVDANGDEVIDFKQMLNDYIKAQVQAKYDEVATPSGEIYLQLKTEMFADIIEDFMTLPVIDFCDKYLGEDAYANIESAAKNIFGYQLPTEELSGMTFVDFGLKFITQPGDSMEGSPVEGSGMGPIVDSLDEVTTMMTKLLRENLTFRIRTTAEYAVIDAKLAINDATIKETLSDGSFGSGSGASRDYPFEYKNEETVTVDAKISGTFNFVNSAENYGLTINSDIAKFVEKDGTYKFFFGNDYGYGMGNDLGYIEYTVENGIITSVEYAEEVSSNRNSVEIVEADGKFYKEVTNTYAITNNIIGLAFSKERTNVYGISAAMLSRDTTTCKTATVKEYYLKYDGVEYYYLDNSAKHEEIESEQQEIPDNTYNLRNYVCYVDIAKNLSVSYRPPVADCDHSWGYEEVGEKSYVTCEIGTPGYYVAKRCYNCGEIISARAWVEQHNWTSYDLYELKGMQKMHDLVEKEPLTLAGPTCDYGSYAIYQCADCDRYFVFEGQRSCYGNMVDTVLGDYTNLACGKFEVVKSTCLCDKVSELTVNHDGVMDWVSYSNITMKDQNGEVIEEINFDSIYKCAVTDPQCNIAYGKKYETEKRGCELFEIEKLYVFTVEENVYTIVGEHEGRVESRGEKHDYKVTGGEPEEIENGTKTVTTYTCKDCGKKYTETQTITQTTENNRVTKVNETIVQNYDKQDNIFETKTTKLTSVYDLNEKILSYKNERSVVKSDGTTQSSVEYREYIYNEEDDQRVIAVEMSNANSYPDGVTDSYSKKVYVDSNQLVLEFITSGGLNKTATVNLANFTEIDYANIITDYYYNYSYNFIRVLFDENYSDSYFIDRLAGEYVVSSAHYKVERLEADKYGTNSYYEAKITTYVEQCKYVVESRLSADAEWVAQDNERHYSVTKQADANWTGSCARPIINHDICDECGDYVSTELYITSGHKYDYDYDKEIYICADCGLENVNGVDGNVVIEDLTQDGSSVLEFGYYKRGSYSWYHGHTYYYCDNQYEIKVGLLNKENDEEFIELSTDSYSNVPLTLPYQIHFSDYGTITVDTQNLINLAGGETEFANYFVCVELHYQTNNGALIYRYVVC